MIQVKRVGGLTFVKCGRVGGSFYIQRRPELPTFKSRRFVSIVYSITRAVAFFAGCGLAY